ncbi:agenet domain-containing protein/bromo-adjacent domain-containing protein, partial [Trifolium medium]|nr:agenet domain-containing protein/bromo-adjacent domain-containing protein [Trifolium medium]
MFEHKEMGELLDDSGKAVGYMYTDGINANNKKIPDKLISRNLKFQSSDIDWSGTAWFCAKQLKHYSGFDRKGTTIY